MNEQARQTKRKINVRKERCGLEKGMKEPFSWVFLKQEVRNGAVGEKERTSNRKRRKEIKPKFRIMDKCRSSFFKFCLFYEEFGP